MKMDLLSVVMLLALVLTGCNEGPKEMTAADRARRILSEDKSTVSLTPDELRRRLGTNEMATFLMSGNDIVEANLYQSGIRSIEGLKGLPLRSIDLGFTKVTDLSPLKDMKLESLVLENTMVSDLSVIGDMPLKVLMLQNTKVTDFSVLKKLYLRELNLLNLPFADTTLLAHMPLESLWLDGTQIASLISVPAKDLISLNLSRTSVSDLTPVSGMVSLRRLNIADTPVTDLTPLKGLRLERIVLTPQRIRSGMEVLREMESLVLIQTDVQQQQAASEFWKRYDLGLMKPESAEPPAGTSEPQSDESNK
ncbi:MAG: leucine-rich repeat domain-containing protein [Planctomycetota bacterium]